MELPSAELPSAELLSAGQRDWMPERHFFSVAVALSLSLVVVPGLATESLRQPSRLLHFVNRAQQQIAIVSKPAVKSITLVLSSR